MACPGLCSIYVQNAHSALNSSKAKEKLQSNIAIDAIPQNK